MDPSEIIKAIPDAAKAVGPVASIFPISGAVKKMFGPAAEEFAEMWRDEIRLYRYGRQLKCVEKAEKMASDAGFTPKAVPPKILFPLLDGASMEEDETLHTMWAALLANAASCKGQIVRPSFISLLREMAPDEAELLVLTADESKELEREFDVRLAECSGSSAPDHTRAELNDMRNEKITKQFEITKEYAGKFAIMEGEDRGGCTLRRETCISALVGHGLMYRRHRLPACQLTEKGYTFLTACSAPKSNT